MSVQPQFPDEQSANGQFVRQGDAFRRQQSRWATGIFQCAFQLLVPVLRSEQRLAVKWQAAVHMFSYGASVLMLVQLLCYPILLFGRVHNADA